MEKHNVNSFIKMKERGEKISALTAYDFTMAALMDKAGLDMILIGDSCGNVISGYDTTIPVELDDIIYHTRAVKRAVKRAFVVADMPFMTFQESTEQALHNAGKLMQKGGAEGVKLEGGQRVVDTVQALTQAGIPVLGHLGLTPQSVHTFGGYRIQGQAKAQADKLKKDACALQEAGAFGIVLEKIPAQLAQQISAELEIPTIGIGAGPECDGQILVSYDMLGMNEKFNPKFLRKYANLGQSITEAVQHYTRDVKAGEYPNSEESY